MAMYHISADGKPRVCRAKNGVCYLMEADGAQAAHAEFPNAEAAWVLAEKVNRDRAENGGKPPVFSKRGTLDRAGRYGRSGMGDRKSF